MAPTATRQPAPGALALVQAFASTHAYNGHDDDLRTDDTAAVWLDTHQANFRGSTPQLRMLRDQIRDLIATSSRASIEWLTAQLNSDSVTIRYDPDAQLLRFEPNDNQLPAHLVAAIANAVQDGSWSRLHLCENAEECAVAFYDRSRSRQGKWCSAAICGNRINSRRHRSRT